MVIGRPLFRSLFLAWLCSAVSALAEIPPEFDPVVRIFSGISHADHDLIRAATTDDFLLLEAGELWDLDYLLGMIHASDRRRDNYFGVISVERFGEATLINYWNKAVISSSSGETVRAWLESVVAIETPKGWTLKQMHSTRIEPASIPQDVELTLLPAATP